MSEEALDIVRQSAECWNAGDFESMFELYSDDLVVVTGEHWLEANVTTEGKDAFRESTREWLSVWESIEMETDHVEAFGDRVVAAGHWLEGSAERSRGPDPDAHVPDGAGWEDQSA